MMTTGSLARALASTAPSEVVVTRQVILDWRDGPLEGFISVANPLSHWHFRIIAGNERPDDVDDRLFALAPIGDALMDQVLRAVSADNARVNNTPDPSVIDHSSLDAVLEQVGRPEVFALFPVLPGIERTWLVGPDVVVQMSHGRL